MSKQRFRSLATAKSPTQGTASSGCAEEAIAAATFSSLRSANILLTQIGKYCANSFADQRLRDGKSDTVSRACHKSGVPVRIEGLIEHAHVRSIES